MRLLERLKTVPIGIAASGDERHAVKPTLHFEEPNAVLYTFPAGPVALGPSH
jgi:hypothetical protein